MFAGMDPSSEPILRRRRLFAVLAIFVLLLQVFIIGAFWVVDLRTLIGSGPFAMVLGTEILAALLILAILYKVLILDGGGGRRG